MTQCSSKVKEISKLCPAFGPKGPLGRHVTTTSYRRAIVEKAMTIAIDLKHTQQNPIDYPVSNISNYRLLNIDLY